jgi:hypothetical protein
MAITLSADISRMVVLGNKEVFTKNFAALPREYPGYTTPKTATKWTEYYDSMGNLTAGYEKFENTKLTYGKVTQAYQTSCETRGWANGYAHSKEAILKDLFGVINSVKAKELARTMKDMEEARAVYWLDNAFATALLADGAYLCSNSHPLLNAAGQYNDTLTTGGLSYDNIKTGIQMFVDFKNHAGGPMVSYPDRIITHAWNQALLEEIFGSEKAPHELSNTKNVLPTLKRVFLHYLSSKTAWFLEDSTYEHILFQRLQGASLEFNNAEDKVESPGDMYINAIDYYNTCALPNVGIVGSQG